MCGGRVGRAALLVDAGADPAAADHDQAPTPIAWSGCPESLGYSVSTRGEVLGKRGTLMTQRADASGYFAVTLHAGRMTHPRLVHRLVALTYIPNPENKPIVRHKNGVRSDNSRENLEWASLEEAPELIDRFCVRCGAVFPNPSQLRRHEARKTPCRFDD